MKILFILILSSVSLLGFSQNTVGTLVYDSEAALDAYNLFYPNLQSNVFLIDNCGQLINLWEGSQDSRPGFTAKLDSSGNLIKAVNSIDIQHYFGAGGSGGLLESHTWDNELLWQHVASDSVTRQHHDFELMPNGNILYISWKQLFYQEIKQLGFDTISNQMEKLWFECIKEYSPEFDSIVWEWCSDHHTVQEFDPSLPNYGLVDEHPDRIDINYQEFSFSREDWLHANSVAYNEELDQVALSVRNMNEVWIIDHSTTTFEATTASGGNSNKGGRILHRWGNPAAYGKGDSQSRMLFYPHNVKWINDVSNEYHGQILVYNNSIAEGLSLGAMYNTPFDEDGNYLLEEGIFLPSEFTRQISHPDTSRNESLQGSNVELLSNGNFFMQASQQGRGFELTDDETVVWEYVIPFSLGEPVPQGTVLNPVLNFNFSMKRYSATFSAFEEKDLSPKGYLELEPNTDFCTISDLQEPVLNPSLKIISNPVADDLYIESSKTTEVMLYNLQGQNLLNFTIALGQNQIDISHLPGGLYFLRSDDRRTIEKFVKL